MRYEEIEKVLEKKEYANKIIQIKFKVRSPVRGMFIVTSDYKELSRKNLWRIVSEGQLKSFKETGDESLARIFNGVEFTKLELT